MKEVREHKRTEWRTVDASEVLERYCYTRGAARADRTRRKRAAG